MSIKTNLQATGLRKAYEYIDKDPMNRLPKLVEIVDKFVPSGNLDGQLAAIKSVVSDPDNNWYQLIENIWADVDQGIRKALFENFVINATLKWSDVNADLQKKHDCNIPWAILMDPTSACNLKCTGCWAAEYGKGFSHNRIGIRTGQLAG